MKNVRTSNSTGNIPPFSAALLVLALCLSIVAWRALEINRDPVPTHPAPKAAPTELRASDSPAVQAAYRAHRHQAASLGESASAEPAIRHRPGGSILKRAIL